MRSLTSLTADVSWALPEISYDPGKLVLLDRRASQTAGYWHARLPSNLGDQA